MRRQEILSRGSRKRIVIVTRPPSYSYDVTKTIRKRPEAYSIVSRHTELLQLPGEEKPGDKPGPMHYENVISGRGIMRLLMLLRKNKHHGRS